VLFSKATSTTCSGNARNWLSVSALNPSAMIYTHKVLGIVQGKQVLRSGRMIHPLYKQPPIRPWSSVFALRKGQHTLFDDKTACHPGKEEEVEDGKSAVDKKYLYNIFNNFHGG